MNNNRIISSQTPQGVLFSSHFIGDRLPQDHEVFVFQNLVKKLNLSVITDSYSNEGGSMFSPVDLFAVICYGYQKGLVSSYQLADAVSNRLDFIFLAGGHQIKRRTLSEFRRRHRGALAELLAQSINLAVKADLVSLDSVFALDGSKIMASANVDRRKDRQEWIEVQNKLIESVEDFLDEWEKNDEAEENIEDQRAERMRKVREKINNLKVPRSNVTNRLPTNEELDKIRGRRKKPSDKKPDSPGLFDIRSLKDAEKAARMTEKIDRTLKETNLESINMTDPDSRIMKFGNNYKEGFNAQVISNNHFVVAADVSLSENDQNQLEPMVNSLLKTIQPNDSESIMLLADAGYNRGENLAWLETKPQVDPYVSMYRRKDENEFSKDVFRYDEENDEYTCPAGKVLETLREITKNNMKYTVYGSSIENCVFCKSRESCLSGDDIRKGYRTIVNDSYAPLRHAMKEKLSSEIGRKLYKKRGGAIEPLFGYFKMKGLRYFRMRGLLNVRAEFLLAALALNLKRIAKLQRKQGNLAVC